MKKTFLFLSLFVGLLFISCSDKDFLSTDTNKDEPQTRVASEAAEFYYYKGKKKFISVNPNKRYVIVRQNVLQTRMQSVDIYLVGDSTVGYIVDIQNNQAMATNDNITTFNALLDNQNIIAIEPVVQDDSLLVPVSNEFYVKLKKISDINLLKQEAEKIGCKVRRVLESDETWICLSNTIESDMNSLEASNYLYETGLFESVDPGFLIKYELNALPSDPYYASQWGLKAAPGINVENVWNISKGSSSITVAIVDGGIYSQHPDLSGRMHSYAYNCKDGSNSPTYSDHGTMCAGIVAANHNNIAIAGVAPNVKLMNISAPLPYVTSEQLATGITNAWKNGADVINNSWGSRTNLNADVLETALANALTKGRNGKGCVVCFSAGNEGSIGYPASCNPELMVVGAVTSSGTVWEGSGRGSQLDVVAPGAGIISLTANGGVSDPVNGTSYASPHVAGIAALILSVYPHFTQKQVSSVITETAGSSWNKNTGWGRVKVDKAFSALNGDFYIASPTGKNVYTTAKFFIPGLPKSAQVTWSTSKNVAESVKNTNDTIVYRYNFSGRSMTDEIRARVTYCGKVFNFTYSVVVYNEPRITSVEQIFYSPDPTRIDLQVNCTDPTAQFTWTGSNDFTDFPYIGDASFMLYPNIYKSIYLYQEGTYSLTVKSDNQFASDIYNFQIIKSYSGIRIIN